MSNILAQLKSQKAAEKAALENLDEKLEVNEVELFETSLEAVDDTTAAMDLAITQLIRIGDKVENNEGFSDEVLELEKCIASVHRVPAATLEALDELKDLSADREAVVTLLAKGSLKQTIKLLIQRLYTSFKLAFKKFASKDQVKAMEKFIEDSDKLVADAKPNTDVKETKYKAMHKDSKEIEMQIASYNAICVNFESIVSQAITKAVKLKSNGNLTLDMSKVILPKAIWAINKSFDNLPYEQLKYFAVTRELKFVTPMKDSKVEEVTLKDPASAANIKTAGDLAKKFVAPKGLYDKLGKLTKAAQDLTDEASKQISKEDGAAKASVMAKASGALLKLVANISSAEKALANATRKEYTLFRKAVTSNAK